MNDMLESPVTNTPLPPHRQAQIEAGLAQYQSVLAQRDELDAKLSEACKTIAGLTVQLDSLKSVTNMMESSYTSAKILLEGQVEDYRRQRDDAVTRTASLEAVLANIFAMLKHTIVEQDGDVQLGT